MSSSGEPIRRVSLTPAPSLVGMPRSLRMTRAEVVVVAMGGSWGYLCQGWRRCGAAVARLAGCGVAGVGCRVPVAARASLLQGGEAPGAVDARVAGEVRGNGGRADVLAACKPGDRLLVEAEAAEVVGEVQHPARGQPGDRGAQQFHVRGL